MKVWYSVEEICEESLYEMNASWDEIDRLVAQECADDYHHNHNVSAVADLPARPVPHD